VVGRTYQPTGVEPDVYEVSFYEIAPRSFGATARS
jgi:hypothetical protein